MEFRCSLWFPFKHPTNTWQMEGTKKTRHKKKPTILGEPPEKRRAAQQLFGTQLQIEMGSWFPSKTNRHMTNGRNCGTQRDRWILPPAWDPEKAQHAVLVDIEGGAVGPGHRDHHRDEELERHLGRQTEKDARKTNRKDKQKYSEEEKTTTVRRRRRNQQKEKTTAQTQQLKKQP